MISLKCSEESLEKNPYQILTISLCKNTQQELIFTFQTEKAATRFWHYVGNLCSSIKEYSGTVTFMLDEDALSDNTVALKGNLLDAIQRLADEGVLQGKNRKPFEDKEEEEIQSFLAESAKTSSFPTEVTEDMEGEETKGKNTQRCPGCNIF